MPSANHKWYVRIYYRRGENDLYGFPSFQRAHNLMLNLIRRESLRGRRGYRPILKIRVYSKDPNLSDFSRKRLENKILVD